MATGGQGWRRVRLLAVAAVVIAVVVAVVVTTTTASTKVGSQSASSEEAKDCRAQAEEARSPGSVGSHTH